jgi:hypothetical protein
MTKIESSGAHGCEEQWYAMDTRFYMGSGLHEDKNLTSCVHWCIIIFLDETPSTPPLQAGVMVYMEDPIG